MLTTAFAACPLCDAPIAGATVVRTGNTTGHPLYRVPLPETMRWLRCAECSHEFTDRFWNEDGERVLFSSSLPYQLPDPSQAEYLRTTWAKTVRNVAGHLSQTHGRGRVFGATGADRPRWLDVGFGNGALLMLADEFGFNTLGIDVRRDAVERLRAIGYEAICTTFDQAPLQAGSVAVLSMADVLEHIPQPRAALAKAHALLEPNGLLYISCPNIETVTWRIWEEQQINPYAGELEHCHNFSRTRLLKLLGEQGFDVIDYDVSVRYYSCMEITARRRPS